ncbi:hypothetical protein GN244_ATG20187 [Phytophthora infestans]|uniref:Uncharacterized protein n=1 Tax=Phytophthora infestans TaxID=4787 RepID=A0A833S2U3_PHYIN|nr:hypothetical protein GN244_ATG20187 [Phytophthora infestans]KAF4134286.1 hypothetical protein GN958_ATG16514 [Phytophthora infestans]
MALHQENDKNSTCGPQVVGFDTYCLIAISIHMNTRPHSKIWTDKNLLSDCFRLIPFCTPLPGLVYMSPMRSCTLTRRNTMARRQIVRVARVPAWILRSRTRSASWVTRN